jgi:hypothetical protein
MISGTRLPLATSLLLLTSATGLASEFDTNVLLARLVRPGPDTTLFVEIRYSAMLTEPIVAAGELEHRVDGALVRRVTAPYRETTVLAGEGVLVMREGRKPRRLSLDRTPELRGMLASFGALLQGDRAMLERHFEVTAAGTDAGWHMELTPRDDKLKTRLARIQVDGANGDPRCFMMVEPDGDASLMALGIQDRSALPAALDRQSLLVWCANDKKAK